MALRGVPSSVLAILSCSATDLKMSAWEGDGRVALFSLGFLLGDWWLRRACFGDSSGDSFSDGRRCRSFLSLNFRRWIRLVFPTLFGNPIEVFGLVGRLNSHACPQLCNQLARIICVHCDIVDPTLADAICDRLLHNAYKIELKGDSMRKDEIGSTNASLVTNQKNAKGENLADDMKLELN